MSHRTDSSERPSLADTFLAVARVFAERSTCPGGARHGCVITVDDRVIATGYGSPPIGAPACPTCYLRDEFARTGKKDWSVCPSIHAEANAVACAARNGVSTKGATAWVTREPCERCYALLRAAGIIKVYWSQGANMDGKRIDTPSKEFQVPVSGPSGVPSPTQDLSFHAYTRVPGRQCGHCSGDLAKSRVPGYLYCTRCGVGSIPE